MITILNWRVNYLNWQFEVKEKTGVAVSFINLSGGVGVNYRPEQEPNDIAVIGKGVHRVFDEVLIPAGLGDVKIFTELGRFMLAPHGLLVTKVRHRKQTYRTYIGVDASAVNLMRPAMYDCLSSYHLTCLILMANLKWLTLSAHFVKTMINLQNSVNCQKRVLVIRL